MTRIKLLPLICLFSFFNLFSQEENDAYNEKKVWRIAVFPIIYSDIPTNYLANFPSKNEIERLVFHQNIQDLYKFVSNDEFVLAGDVYDITTNPNTFWTSAGGQLLSNQQILDGLNFNAPGFDPDNYDLVMFLSGHDASMSYPSNVSLYNYTINGNTYNDIALIGYYQIGYQDRDSINYFFSNSWIRKNQYLIPLGSGQSEEADVWYALSQSEGTFCHEIGHSLEIFSHSNSSTNGAFPIDDPEIPNNEDFLNLEYGNQYCLMGNQLYSPSINGYFRNVTGILPQSEIISVDDYGTHQVTVYPINEPTNPRHIEVLLPYEKSTLGYKNHGYGLEVRKASSFDTLLSHPQLNENVNGLFVHKINDLQNLLLDMSPSSNLPFSWGQIPDIRDVVLKPGMTYENNFVKFENVVSNMDGSFTLDITIKNLKDLTPEPTINSTALLGTNQIEISWTNNHLGSGNTEDIYIEYRSDTSYVWRKLDSVNNSISSYTTGFTYTGINGIEFRLKVKESTTNHESKYSNIGTIGCNLRIEDLIEHPISCVNENDGKIEIVISGGNYPIEFSVDNANFQSGNLIENLSPGPKTIYVKDANNCSVSMDSKNIWEPKHIISTDQLIGDTLEIDASGGTGRYLYRVNSGNWTRSNIFYGITQGYTFEVIDRNNCSNQDVLSIEEVSFNENEFVIFPNPSSDYFELNTSNVDKLEIYNSKGKLIKEFNSQKKYPTIDLSAGFYVVKVFYKNEISSYKLIVK